MTNSNSYDKSVELYDDIKLAIENEQIDIFFQPQIDVSTSTVFCLEALSRWEHSIHGYISPAVFINICETTDLIQKFTKFVITKTFQYFKTLQEQGYKGRVSLNLSRLQLEDDILLSLILDETKRLNLEPKNIEFEIHEDSIIESFDSTYKVLTILKEEGFRIICDDFGAGVTSLKYLIKVPIDKIKIDNSFVRDFENSQNGKMLLKTIIQFCENMDYEVLVEGVENSNQLDIISNFNCYNVQGFIFSEALNIDNIISFIKEQKSF